MGQLRFKLRADAIVLLQVLLRVGRGCDEAAIQHQVLEMVPHATRCQRARKIEIAQLTGVKIDEVETAISRPDLILAADGFLNDVLFDADGFIGEVAFRYHLPFQGF